MYTQGFGSEIFYVVNCKPMSFTGVIHTSTDVALDLTDERPGTSSIIVAQIYLLHILYTA